MSAVAGALVYALFVWWFATGLVLLLVLRQHRTVRASLIGAAVLFPVGCTSWPRAAARRASAASISPSLRRSCFGARRRIAFLTGVLTGPRPAPCPPRAKGLSRVGYALGAILYHELALLASGLGVLAVTWGGANQIGALTFLVLYLLRVSAKLNLFLGVPVLNDSFLPAGIDYVRSYFRRGPVSAFFPVSVLLAVLVGCGLAAGAADADATEATQVGYTLVTALLGLAILEHLFMLVQLPLDRLWRWSTRARADTVDASCRRPVSNGRAPEAEAVAQPHG